MADFEENVEEMVGTARQAAGGDRGRRGRDRRQNGGDGWPVGYVDEGPYKMDFCHLCLASIAKFCDGGL